MRWAATVGHALNRVDFWLDRYRLFRTDILTHCMPVSAAIASGGLGEDRWSIARQPAARAVGSTNTADARATWPTGLPSSALPPQAMGAPHLLQHLHQIRLRPSPCFVLWEEIPAFFGLSFALECSTSFHKFKATPKTKVRNPTSMEGRKKPLKKRGKK